VLGSYGLRTYIWNNRLKSLILLAGFPFLLLLIIFGVALVLAALENPTVGDGIRIAIQNVPSLIPIALVGALIWFVIAWFANTSIIAAITGAREVDRASEPRLWNLLENLCISRGIPMPKLRIIETDARNAFASGVRKSQYSITVTRGLMNALDDAELEAVLAHELTHIRNRDVQLLVIAAVFVGIVTLVGDLLIRSPRALLYGSTSGSSSSSSGSGGWRIGRGGSSGGKGKGGGGAIILILIAVAIFLLARVLAIGLRLAMSRKREYLADAGAVELTKNPDAMIGALRKIAGHSEIMAPRSVQEMFLDHSEEAGFSSWFSTHPSIDDRVAALVRYGGGRDMPATEAIEAPPEFGKRIEPLSSPAVSETPATPWGETPPGPWENTR
jgi:heat shock protein HtpX